MDWNRRDWFGKLAASLLGSVIGIALISTIMGGCKGSPVPVETPEQRQALAKKGGEAAALLWVAIDKPSDELVGGVQVVVDKVRGSLSGYVEGGFISSLGEIEKALEDALPGEENATKRLIAGRLAKTLLEELDHLFEKHPDWKTLGAEVAGGVGSFLDGASEGLSAYERKMKEQPKKTLPAPEKVKEEATE